MRKPTPSSKLWSWWEDAVDGNPQPISPNDDPPCGFYKTRKFRWSAWANQNAPWIPCRIFCIGAQVDESGELIEPEIMVAEHGERRFNPYLSDKWIYWTQNPITEEEWEWLKAMMPLTATQPPKKK